MPRQGSPRPDDRQPFLNSGALPFLIIGFVAAELYVFTLIAHRIGFIPAFLLAFVKAALGLALVSAFMRQLFAGMRRQGASILSLSGSKVGTRLLGGILLVLPGYVSGVIGLLLVLPALRGLIRPGAGKRPPPEGVIELEEGEWRELGERRLRGGGRRPS